MEITQSWYWGDQVTSQKTKKNKKKTGKNCRQEFQLNNISAKKC